MSIIVASGDVISKSPFESFNIEANVQFPKGRKIQQIKRIQVRIKI
jgi:hypothetical protein